MSQLTLLEQCTILLRISFVLLSLCDQQLGHIKLQSTTATIKIYENKHKKIYIYIYMKTCRTMQVMHHIYTYFVIYIGII